MGLELGYGMPIWLALFVANIISVVALGWVFVPATDHVFGGWLYPLGRLRRITTVVGLLVGSGSTRFRSC